MARDLPLIRAGLLPRAATHSTWDQRGGVSIQRARDFKFPKTPALSVTIGHHWQQSQVSGRPSSPRCDHWRPMVADGSITILTQSSAIGRARLGLPHSSVLGEGRPVSARRLTLSATSEIPSLAATS